MNEIKKITAEELYEKIKNKEKFKLVDVLLPSSYKDWHIPGAINIQIDEISDNASKFLEKNDEVIVYCASFECQASTRAANELKKLGFKNVTDYKGGKKEWKEKGLPVES
ncbi:MAG: rhodanese-like domain-containing protein [Actinobacteria bacterium]|nr:rhodanese-like domain-containing protein [Actinomycetota bacterium]